MLPTSVIERFLSGVDTCRSVDCVLIKLSSAFLEIRDFSKGFPTKETEAELIHEFLSHPNVMEVLAGLADSIDVVENKVLKDVRFNDLRPYVSQIIDAIRHASEKFIPQQVYHSYERPPLWQIEHREQRASRESKKHKKEYKEYYEVPILYSESGGKRRLSLPKVSSSKASLILYVLLLLTITCVFIGVPWITFYGEQRFIGSLEVKPIKITSSGWGMTWFFIELWQTYNVRPPIFILYFAGLILAVIVFIRRSPVLSVLSGLAMLIGWYDFYSSATTIHKLYVQLAGLLGLVFIKSAKLEVGATLAGFLSLLYLVLGTYLIYKASRH